MIDNTVHAGPQYFDGHIAAVMQSGKVDLGYRGRGHRRRIELAVRLGNWHAQAALDFGHGQRRVEGRNPVLQFGQLVGKVRRQQVAAGREHLTEFDENGPQRL